MGPRVCHLVVVFFFFFFLLPFLSDQAGTTNYSFKHLEGCRKGEKREGIGKVREYLERYGYLKTTSSSSKNPEMVDKSDEFDDALESSLKEFQRFYHLEVTGILDEATGRLMSKPRCGLPDRPASNYSFHPDYAFLLGGRWPDDIRHLLYIVYPEEHPEDPIRKALDSWSAVSNFTFQRVREDSRAVLRIRFEISDGPGGVLGRATVPEWNDAAVFLDKEDCFEVGAVPECYDLQTVAAHEIGHILGLDHSQDETALMFAIATPNSVKPLAQDDIDGIRARYADDAPA